MGLEHFTSVGRRDAKALRRRSLRLMAELLRPHGLRLALLAALVVTAQAAAAAGPLLLANALDAGLPALLAGDPVPFVTVLALLVAAALADACLSNLFTRRTAALSQRLLLHLRTRLFDHTARLDLDFHQRYTSGRVISRQTNDIDSLAVLFDTGIGDLVQAVIRMCFVGTALVLLDPVSALVALVAFLPVIAVTRRFQVVSARLYRESSERSARLIVRFVETMTGMRAVQAFRAEARGADEYGRLNEAYSDTARRVSMTFGSLFTGINLFTAIGLAAVVLVNGLRTLDGTIGVGVLVASALYLTQLFQPMEAIGMFSNTYQSAVAALEKISGVLEERPTVVDPATTRPRDGAPARAERSPNGRGEIELRDVEFAYPDGPTVLHRLSLHIPPGQTLAVVGRTGAGKTTLAGLVARFADPVTGEVLLDGVDLRDIPDAELRRRIVTVTQEPFLFQGTIASNLELGRPGASRAALEDAVRRVGADTFIDRLPLGLDTDLSHRGVRLSAGQRQLVSFARAFVADPEVLILDEATSSLDIPSERAVQHALATLLRDRTAIVIAHRLSTVDDADRILVMDEGRIVEDGSPRDLVRSGGHYAQLHRAWLASLGRDRDQDDERIGG
ncbi:ABC transporter ATP-binding protein [Pseudoclavibacter chungangensis]|uniref:ABC transporter ATP-binding protein n=1 Tax=Pseudoclavibacter chungangensis TaxID=587635 RepID=UPI001CE46F93|nr:ABC transporter ATP-binding protein [Pseudoclavibacter chungangensis]